MRNWKLRTLFLFIMAIVVLFALIYIHFNWVESKDHALFNTVQAIVAVSCIFFLIISIYMTLSKNLALRNEKNKLKEQEILFRTIFEQSPIGIAFGYDSSDIAEVNTAFEKITGRSKEVLSKISWKEITHPDDLVEDLNNFNKFKNEEINGYSMNKRYIRPDGKIVWVRLTLSSLKIEKRPQLSHICIVEDISERIKAEESLRESERNNAMLLSNLPGMAYRCNYDKDWTMHFVSEGCYELTGYKPEDLINNINLTFNDIIEQEYREYLWDKWTILLKNKEVFKEEYPIKTAKGTRKWVYEQGQGVYDQNDKVIAIEGLIIDITDRKKREDEINYLNYHDVLTGVYNRTFFEVESIRLDTNSQYPLSVIIGDINGLKLINDALGHAEGDKLIVTMAKILSKCCRKDDVLARIGGDEFIILLPKTSSDDVYKIMKRIESVCEEYRKNTKDDSYHTCISLGCATKTDNSHSLSSTIKIAEDYMYRRKLLQSKSVHSSIISSMKATLFEKSQETEEHALRLIELSKTVGVKMNLTDEQLNELELLSTLHDIGKIGINDNILNKPDKLTQEEWIEMKKHPEVGYRIAMTSQELAPIAECILSHHEHWDGNGYPQGLKGEDIPLLSRILAIADAYDAMTEDRPYRKAMSKEAAIKEIKVNAGTQFDSVIAKIFIEYLCRKN